MQNEQQQQQQQNCNRKLYKYTGGRKVVGEVCASVGSGWGGGLTITHTLKKSNAKYVKHAHMRTCIPIKSVQQTVDRSTECPESLSV